LLKIVSLLQTRRNLALENLMTGFTDSSLDWGGGIRVQRVLYDRRAD